jgi:hypothetical protein
VSEKDYSDYVHHVSNVSSSISVSCGFAFTAVTILVTWLPDPTEAVAQLTLFLMGTLFHLDSHLLLWNTARVVRYCKNLPPETREIRLFYGSLALVTFLLGYIIPLMFLIRHLVHLAVISTVVWTIMNVLAYLTVWKPHYEFRTKSLQSRN